MKQWILKWLGIEPPFEDFAICERCSNLYTDYNKHIEYCGYFL